MEFLRRLRARLRREHGVPSGFTKIELPGGGRLLVDQTMLEYLNSTAPDPSQGVLDAVMAEVRRVRVLRGGMASDEPLEKVVLFETAKDTAISMLRETLRIVDGPAGHCMCYGDPTLELLGASSQRLALIAVHHGQSIRWKSWRHDARLVAGRPLLEWLAGHGATYPLEEYEANVRRQRAERGAWDRWLAAMPACLRCFLEQTGESLGYVTFVPAPAVGGHGAAVTAPTGPVKFAANYPTTKVASTDLALLLNALGEAHPDSAKQALMLFAWFGSGAGPWSGFPAYESVAENLLMTLHIKDLLRALECAELTPEHLEGAARLFGGWAFRTKRGTEFARLPEPMKRRLLDHSMQCADPDKRSRAQAAFHS